MGKKGLEEDNTEMRLNRNGFFSMRIVAQSRLSVAGKVVVVVGLWGDWTK